MGEINETEMEAFEESMNLIDKISDACEGADYYNMLFAIASVTAMLLNEIRNDTGKDASPLLLKLLKDHLHGRQDKERMH